jgi:REP element-mobilizing transposase RayT
MRVLASVWNMRNKQIFAVIKRALQRAADHLGGRLVHFSVQSNHIHLLVECDDRAALIRYCRGLAIRIAKNLNRLMGTSGQVITDRYHAHVLRTPTEVRNAIHYILQNGRKHLAEIEIFLSPGWIDPCCSLAGGIALPSPCGWLLKEEERRARGEP